MNGNVSHSAVAKRPETLKKILWRKIVLLTFFQFNVYKGIIESDLRYHFIVKQGPEHAFLGLIRVSKGKLIYEVMVTDIYHVFDINLRVDACLWKFLLFHNACPFLMGILGQLTTLLNSCQILLFM